MTIDHRLHLQADIALPILDSLGLSLPLKPSGAEGMLLVHVTEEDASWPRVAAFLKEYHRAWAAHPGAARHVAQYAINEDPLADFFDAIFSAAELKAAPYLALGASMGGFPQPDDILEFYRITYQTDCPACRIGTRQVHPLCLTREPNWGKCRGILQLEWVHDEFLVKPEMFEEVFRPFGITTRPVLNFKSRSNLRTVVQLEIPVRVDVDVEDLTYQVCRSCGERAYDHSHRNYAPMPSSAPGPIFKSNQWFAPFHSVVYVTQELFRSIEKSGFRGADFWPCFAQLNAEDKSGQLG